MTEPIPIHQLHCDVTTNLSRVANNIKPLKNTKCNCVLAEEKTAKDSEK